MSRLPRPMSNLNLSISRYGDCRTHLGKLWVFYHFKKIFSFSACAHYLLSYHWASLRRVWLHFLHFPHKIPPSNLFLRPRKPTFATSHLPKHIWHFYISSTKLFPVPDFPSSLRVQALLNVVLRTFLSGKTKEKKAIPLFYSKKCIEIKLCFLFLEKYVFYMAANKNQEQKY